MGIAAAKSEKLELPVDLDAHTPLKEIIEDLLTVWPEHFRHVYKALDGLDDSKLANMNEVAGYSLKLVGGDLRKFSEDYRWMCERFVEEQFFFFRNDHYRLSTIEEAIEKVYGNAEYMSKYVHGILLSQIFWRNHADAMYLYRSQFLPKNKDGYDHLEIGPGHGLFLVFAAKDPRAGSLCGWDISPSSLRQTKEALQTMGVNADVTVEENDVVTADKDENRFDSIICSEVLEHVEEPQRALRNLLKALRPGGRLFLNIPVNSPAPDHIYLWRDPQEIKDMVEKQGFEIEQFHELPTTGKTLEQARKQKLDISCITIACKPD